MGMLQEFKKFALRGNVVDMGVGIIIGASFGTVVKSLVDDVLMPPLGLILGNVDFSNLFITLDGGSYASLAAAEEAGAPLLKYGMFINAVVSFLIVAFAVFWLVKGMNALSRKEEEKPAAPPEPPEEVKLLGEIRDLLKDK